MGKRIAQGMVNYYDPATWPTGVQGPVMSSASFSGNDITVTFSLSGASTLRGKTGASGLNGFVVKNGSGVAQTISSTAIPSAGTVTLTMASAPASGWTVEFLPDPQVTITNLPYGDLPCLGVTGNDTVPAMPGTVTLTL